MTPLKISHARIFVRSLRDWSAASQVKVAVAWCEARGVSHVIYDAKEHGRDAWLRALRETEAAVLPGLDVLAEMRPVVKRPTIDLASTLSRVVARAALVVDARLGVTSDDNCAWPTAVEAGMNRVSSGRTLTRRKARAMGKKGAAVTSGRSIRREWESRDREEDLERQRHIWTSSRYRTWEEAREKLHKDLRGMPFTTLWRLLGKRGVQYRKS